MNLLFAAFLAAQPALPAPPTTEPPRAESVKPAKADTKAAELDAIRAILPRDGRRREPRG